MFPHSPEVVRGSFGYHPLGEDLGEVARFVEVSRLLVLGAEVPEIHGVQYVRYIASPPEPLPRGLYWFATTDANSVLVHVLLVVDGGPTAAGVHVAAEELSESHHLVRAAQWHSSLWESASAKDLPVPAFGVGDEVIVAASGADGFIRVRRFSSGTWLYDVRVAGHIGTFAEEQLAPFPTHDDPEAWLQEPPSDVTRFAATLTRAKLEGSFSDTVFSFRATRTQFRAYQFKPVIKFLQAGKSRLLIADEVGLGKTIEAGLIWTELEARRGADRVLVVTPASLVAKWRMEMEERFNFILQELDQAALTDFEDRVRTGTSPTRGAWIGSLEKLRRWPGLEEIAAIIPGFDLIIFDEAHALRNTDTKSNAFASVITEMTENLVFLSATPVNLHSRDLFNLLDLLSPGEFGDELTLEEQLRPNAVLHQIAGSLGDAAVPAKDRLASLSTLAGLPFGRPLTRRPEYMLLLDLFASSPLSPRDIVRAKRLLADLSPLALSISRTRKVEVDEVKAIREPHVVEVEWTPPESAFYREYLRWCKDRAVVAGTPVGFSMQMPLRLASACLPAARDQVLNWEVDRAGSVGPVDEDDPSVTRVRSRSVPPHEELRHAAAALGGSDSKFDLLLPTIRELIAQGRQCLLFTFSRPTLDYLQQRLADDSRVAVMHGGVSKQARRRIMADFRAGSYDVLLANRVASEGLDFEFCSAVINYDLPWNPMEIEQRIGRIDRFGQKEDVILVVNFYNEETIDEKIMRRVLARIGIFERSIGALEPIILSRLPSLKEAMLDFTLSDGQRTAKTDQVLEAIEAQTVGIEDLASASSFLLTSDDVDVRGMESDILRSGRYVGQSELANLVSDWCHSVGAASATAAQDGSTLRIRGNAAMAHQIRALTAHGLRSTLEVHELTTSLQSELEIHLVLDQEVARTSGQPLLSATHPFVLASLAVPGFRHARFATVRLGVTMDSAPQGRFLVHLVAAQWTGVRPGREIWGAAVDAAGNEAPDSVAAALLSHLAGGGLADGGPVDRRVANADNLRRTSQLLDRRLVRERVAKLHESAALLESRRVTITTQHRRKLDGIDSRIATAAQGGGDRGVTLFRAQRTRAEVTYQRLLTELEQAVTSDLQVHPLALCDLVISHD